MPSPSMVDGDDSRKGGGSRTSLNQSSELLQQLLFHTSPLQVYNCHEFSDKTSSSHRFQQPPIGVLLIA